MDLLASLLSVSIALLHLSLGQIYAALAYYHTNREEIESALAASDAKYDELANQAGHRGDDK